MCQDDCNHLILCIRPQGQRQHWVVLCTSDRKWPEQFIITNHMMKGRLPHGLLQRLVRAHKQWLENKGVALNEPCTRVRMTKDTARQAVERAVSAFVMCMKDVSRRVHATHTDDTNGDSGRLDDEGSDTTNDHEPGTESDAEGADDDEEIIDEADFGHDRLQHDKQVKPLQPSLRTYKT